MQTFHYETEYDFIEDVDAYYKVQRTNDDLL